jgi:hypothetical protein
MKLLIGCIAAVGLATCATAQQAGSTYPEGSNLPQRTAGEVGTKPAAPNSGSAGPTGAARSGKKAVVKAKSNARRHRSHPHQVPSHR